MGLFSTLAPLASIGLASTGVGLPLAMGGSALMGALAANERNQELNSRQRRSADAAADAIGVSWGRRDGRGSIPAVQYNNESETGNLGAGALTGAMQAYGLKDSKGFFGNSGTDSLFSSDETQLKPTSVFGSLGKQGNLGASLGVPDLSGYTSELPTLFGKFRK